MKRDLIVTVVMQSLGPLCVFLFTIYLARNYGLEAQGVFAETKSWAELLVAVGCFGLPQSVIISINQRNASRILLRKQALIYSSLWIPVFFVASYFFALQLRLSIAASIMIAAGGSSLVAAGIHRGIFLTLDAGMKFHLITISPAIFMAFFTFFSLFLCSDFEISTTIPVAIGVAGVSSLGFSLLLFKSPQEQPDSVTVEYKRLFADGFDVFLQAAMSTAQIYVAYAWLRSNGNNNEVAFLNTAILIAQMILFPLASISPMILNYWSKLGDSEFSKLRVNSLLALTVGVTFTVLIAAAMTPLFVPVVFGSNYYSAVDSIQILLLSCAPAIIGRVANLAVTSRGNFKLGSISVASKFFVFALGLAFLEVALPNQSTAAHISGIFLLSEMISFLIIIGSFIRTRKL